MTYGEAAEALLIYPVIDGYARIDAGLVSDVVKMVKDLEKDNERYLNHISMLQEKIRNGSKWISVEDERKPKEGESCIVRSSTDCITIRKYEKGGFPDNHRIRYWMHNPDLPKPKEPTFRDVFLKAFPKTPFGYNGALKLCARNVFPQINCSLSNGCAECWKQTYFEEEGDV